MEVKELDVVRLKDGRIATVLQVYAQAEAYLVEIADESGRTQDMPVVTLADIEEITYIA